jgi:colicin import membrane protein
MTSQNLITNELKKFEVTDAAIAAMSKEFMALTIQGLDDREGYKRVKESRIFVKSKRVAVEKTRKELKEESLNFGRMVDAEAKRIFALLEPIESHLEAQETAIDKEKERIKAEEEAKAQAAINARVAILAGYGRQGDLMTVAMMPPDQFEAEVVKAKVEFEAEQARKAEEERRKKEESERLVRVAEEQAKERARLEAMAKEQEEKQAAIRKQEEALIAEKAAIKSAEDAKIAEASRLEELERVRREATEKAKADAEREAKAKAEKEAESARLEAEKSAKKERLRPDREKLAALAEAIQSITRPALKSQEAKAALQEAEKLLSQACTYLKKGDA